MRWRWPPWRREEPDVHEIERSGATARSMGLSTDPRPPGSVAPTGPVITRGSVNVRSTTLFLTPVRSNCPLLAGSVREIVCGTPGKTAPNTSDRTPETVRGRP